MKTNKNEKIVNHDQKKEYLSPTVELVFVEIENGIAAASRATITITSGTDPNGPDIEDWNTDGSTQDTHL
ncbi:hypothetical protein [Elizabethkingia meningoseptica]|uniref:hypothetical protein n=1 Tax=Elizabethkingia meningoseptica TaxID=238 RepID=UPI003892291C